MSCHSFRFTPLLLLAAVGLFAFFAGCTDQCERARDCDRRGDICYLGVCTPGSQVDELCDSDSDCNSGMAMNLRCVSGRCIVDPSAVIQPCSIMPLCFDTGGATPQVRQTMTATTGSDPDDRGAAMSSVVAVTQTGNNIVNIVAQNPTTGRRMCISLNVANQTCDLLQVSSGDPNLPNVNVFETENCNVSLTNTVGFLVGDADGVVTDCTNMAFAAEAVFDVTRQ